MPYRLVNLEVTAALPTLTLTEAETGVALIVRRQHRPIGFWMQALAPKSVLEPKALANLLAQNLSHKLLQESLRAELMPAPKTDGFPTLSVAICTKDRPQNVERCLDSLLPLQQAKGAAFEILVVDNAPADGRTEALVAARPTVRYVREPKPGLNFARNRAIAAATGELLAYLDDDVVVDAGWLAGLQEAWAENPDAPAFTGLVLPYELETEAQILFERGGGFRRGFEKIRYGQSLPGNPLHPCGAGIFGAGCNMAFQRQVLRKLGGFDEALDTGAPLPGGGDLDIFYRVIRAGFPLVYEPQYLVFHQHRREVERLRHQYWTWGLGFMAFVIKSYGSDPPQRSQLRRLILWWLKYQLRQVKARLRGRHPLPLPMLLSEFWGGIVGLFGEYPRSLKRVDQIRRQFS